MYDGVCHFISVVLRARGCSSVLACRDRDVPSLFAVRFVRALPENGVSRARVTGLDQSVELSFVNLGRWRAHETPLPRDEEERRRYLARYAAEHDGEAPPRYSAFSGAGLERVVAKYWPIGKVLHKGVSASNGHYTAVVVADEPFSCGSAQFLIDDKTVQLHHPRSRFDPVEQQVVLVVFERFGELETLRERAEPVQARYKSQVHPLPPPETGSFHDHHATHRIFFVVNRVLTFVS